MTRTLDALLDDLADYLGTPDTACLSLPREAYTSAELHALEINEIFEKSWLCVGRDEYVPNPGDYYTIDVMGEPVIIVRGTDGTVRALNAACRHRSMPVVQDRGNATRFTCPYHAWTYATDGRLIGAPHMEQSQAFDRNACRLPQYRLDRWMGFLFVNLDDDAGPLQPVMASMNDAVANYRVGEQTEIFHYETEWEGNWKLSAENSMEYYHHIALHAGTVGVQMPARGTYIPTVPATDSTFTHERCRMGEKFIGGQDHPMNPKGDLRGLTDEELTTGYMVYVFPAFTMAMRPGTNNWLSFRPHGPERTKVLGGYLVWKEIAQQEPDLANARRDMIEKVNREDSLATSELAKAMRSRKAARGPLSHFEGTIAQFYKYLARTIAADRASVQARGDAAAAGVAATDR
ncbi:MAG TPA: aromatic ring-hydroxylating dioxygenase subunit alpha [Methylomirabilota bacterium]|nr:aromatic ring-hydroxylating dioxygenase subunit alpha [Methylomirabilota bacterium]